MQIDPVDSKNNNFINVGLQTKKFIIDFPWFFEIPENIKSLIRKLFFLKTYIDKIVIFGIYRVDLHNRILISAWLDDLHFLASSTVRPKL